MSEVTIERALEVLERLTRSHYPYPEHCGNCANFTRDKHPFHRPLELGVCRVESDGEVYLGVTQTYSLCEMWSPREEEASATEEPLEG